MNLSYNNETYHHFLNDNEVYIPRILSPHNLMLPTMNAIVHLLSYMNRYFIHLMLDYYIYDLLTLLYAYHLTPMNLE